MNIFVLLSRIPWPLEKGDKLRALHQIKTLSIRNTIHLCALNDDGGVDKVLAMEKLKPYCQTVDFIDIPKLSQPFNMLRAFLTGMPIQCGYFYNSRVHSRVHSLIQKYQPEVVYGQLVRVAPYLISEKVCKVIDYQDVLSYGIKRRMDVATFYKRPLFRMEYNRLQRYENQVFEAFDVKTIISDSDRQLIEHPRKNEILVVPNGVDFERFTPRVCEKKYDVVFTGNMAYPPNVKAVSYLITEIMTKVWKALPNVSVCIAGATPAPSVRAAASDLVSVTGWVDDMCDVYSQSKVFIAPMQIGTGLQNKLLEAMAMELPCITTPLANKALQATENEEIIVGETPQDLANAIIRLLTDESFAKSIAQKGSKFVRSRYDWEQTTALLENAMMRN
ncbi:MAG: glycosyltransferase [Bacteroidales bacterium]|nr:glycosyltransferase [Bacteroidales bacterium]